MRIAGIMKNDVVNSNNGVCVSVWAQGCPHRCKGCHNPETWSFNGGYEIDYKSLKEQVIKAIAANNVQRNLSILGGEPLCEENLYWVSKLMHEVKTIYPNIKITLWTGYTLEELQKISQNDVNLTIALLCIDTLIDGRFEEDKKNLSLDMRGSSNQRILTRGIDF